MSKKQKTVKEKPTLIKKVDDFFEISKRGSNFKTEIIAGLTTFFAMAYIVVTNPNQVVSFNHLVRVGYYYVRHSKECCKSGNDFCFEIRAAF